MSEEQKAVNPEVVDKTDPMHRQIAELVKGKVEIKTPMDYTFAAEVAKRIRGARKWVDEQWDGVIASANKTHKEACAKKKAWDDPLKNKELEYKMAMSRYESEAEAERRRAEAAAQAEVNKQIQADIARDVAGLEKAGMVEHAAALKAAPVPVVAVVVPSSVPKIAGISSRKNWKYRVADITKIDHKYLMVNDDIVAPIVRALKDKTDIPGIEPYEEKSMAIG